MKRLDARQGLAASAGGVTVALTGAAFWLSYEHLHDVADGNGLDGARAWAWPGTVDLFIIAGELLILRAALRGRFDWFAYLLAGVGSLGSIALNVAGVGAGAEPLEYIVAAVPPVAALLAFAAVMRQVHERLAGHDEKGSALVRTPGGDQPSEVTVERADDDQPKALPETPKVVPAEARMLPIVARPEPEETLSFAPSDSSNGYHDQPAPEAPNLVTQVLALTPSELRRKASRLNRDLVGSTNRPVTVDRLREEFGLTRRDAAELRRQVVAPTGGERP